jgi:hypothetical protein
MVETPKNTPPVQNATPVDAHLAQNPQLVNRHVLMGRVEAGIKKFDETRNAKIADAAYVSQTNNISFSAPAHVEGYNIVGIFTNEDTINLVKMLRDAEHPKNPSSPSSAQSQEVAVVAPRLPLVPGLGNDKGGGRGGGTPA